jgi:NTE family protein
VTSRQPKGGTATVPPVGHNGYAELLGGAPLFSEFSPAALEALAGRFSERSYDRGDILWRAGDDGNELVVVVQGELEVRGVAPDGTEHSVGRIRPGECGGEMALVLDERRSATVACSRAARVLVLGKDDFREIVRADARILKALTEVLSRRAVALAQRRPVTRTPVVVGVVADKDVPGASLVAAAISQLARDLLGLEALLVRVGDGPRLGASDDTRALPSRLRVRLGQAPVIDVGTPGAPTGAELARIVDATLDAFDERFRLVVVDVPAMAGGGVEAAATACDAVVRVCHLDSPVSDDRVRVFQVMNRYEGPTTPIALNQCEPFVLPIEPSLLPRHGPDTPLSLGAGLSATRVLARLTRKLMGVTVGIALGGGGAFGIAHVGVLLALTQSDIPIDMVAGTSMGSIVALGYASGIEPTEMVDIAGRIGNLRTSLSAIDPSITGTGLLSGRRLVSIFTPLMRHETFDDLEYPCRVVAMDVETGGRVDIGAGRVDAAFRASCSIPIVFTPVRRGAQTLVDGGMIDPVPADVVRDMGADIVIAVNVVPRLQVGVTTALSRAFKRVSRLNPLSYVTGSRNMPDIMDVFMNSLQAIQYELGNFKSLTADVLVNVEMAEFTWIDFHRALDIIGRGEQAGNGAVVEVRNAIEQRLTPVH